MLYGTLTVIGVLLVASVWYKDSLANLLDSIREWADAPEESDYYNTELDSVAKFSPMMTVAMPIGDTEALGVGAPMPNEDVRAALVSKPGDETFNFTDSKGQANDITR